MDEFDMLLAVPFGRFEAAKRKGDHMSWDVSHPNVGSAAPREIMPYKPSDLLEIRSM
jgi:hypothetical protein